MIDAHRFKHRNIAVLGLGKSGAATVAALANAGAYVVMWDDTEKGRNIAEAQLKNVSVFPPDAWDWHTLEAMVLSPGIALTHPKPHPAVALAKAHDCPIIGDIEVLYLSCEKARYIGITGTNGKSTTTTLIGHILQHAGVKIAVGGNLGQAALSLESLSQDGTYVLEMSSYQLDLIRTVRFNTAVLLNLSEDHIDRHGSMQGYIDAKLHIFDCQTHDDVAIIGIDDSYSEAICRQMISENFQHIIPISGKQKVQHGVYVIDGILTNAMGASPLQIDLRQCKSLTGAHNGQNAAAAYTAARTQGIEHAVIAEALQSFKGLKHRMQWLGMIDDVAYVNDSKATNADAAEKALLSYDNIFWILGGVAKEGGIEPLASYFHKIRRAYLIGAAADQFSKTLDGHVEYLHCETLENAFASASHDAHQSGLKSCVVMLSPASASFDQYQNFEQRGEHFIALFDAKKKEQHI